MDDWCLWTTSATTGSITSAAVLERSFSDGSSRFNTGIIGKRAQIINLQFSIINLQ
jgi:hypothetical protein